MYNLKDEARSQLNMYKSKHRLQRISPCTEADNKTLTQALNAGKPLPSRVHKIAGTTNQFCIVETSDLSPEETIELLTYKKIQLLTTIRNCVVFFTVLICISLAFGLLGLIPLLA